MSITATNIRKTFGNCTALAGVDLHVPAGKLVALLGPSGSGKTTLLRILAGLEHADPGGGRVCFHGEDVTEVPAGRRRVGFVFQHYALFRHLTVFENIAFGLRVRARRERPSRAEIVGRVRAMLRQVQLEDFAERYPAQLSGGQRQRVALARALAVEPKVLLLDEPFGALDAKVRKELRRWLRRFHDEISLTTVFVTHDQEEALEIADEVAVMNRARVEQVGPPQEVYDRPATPFVWQFLGNVNLLRTPGGGIAPVRPHDIEVSRSRHEPEDREAVVRAIHAAGPQANVSLTLAATGEPVEAEMARSRLERLRLRPDDRVWLRLRPRRSFDQTDGSLTAIQGAHH